MFSRLYIHTPWCLSKCNYCGFYSLEGSAEEADATSGLVLEEMKLCSSILTGGPLKSIYFGGGTPSLLSPDAVNNIIGLSSSLWGVSSDAEITLEANPCSITRYSLAGYADAGVNRISLGIQSFDDKTLAVLGRRHNSTGAQEAFRLARETSGIKSTGIDLICGLPCQSLNGWQQEISSAIALAPDHISLYALSMEQGSRFAATYSSPEGKKSLPDDETVADMLEHAASALPEAGYGQYEISSFALPGHHSRHNSGYWQRDGYLGLGPGAHSFMADGWGIRFANPSDINLWKTMISAGEPAHQERQLLDRDDAFAEHIFLGLRMSEGISSPEIPLIFGNEIWERHRPRFEYFIANGLMTGTEGRYSLSRRGMMLSNQIFSRFI